MHNGTCYAALNTATHLPRQIAPCAPTDITMQKVAGATEIGVTHAVSSGASRVADGSLSSPPYSSLQGRTTS